MGNFSNIIRKFMFNSLKFVLYVIYKMIIRNYPQTAP